MADITEKKTTVAKTSESGVQKDIFNMLEMTQFESALDPSSQLAPFNSDDLYQKQGDYSVYEDMLKDDQVAVAMSLKKDLVIGGGWEIQITDESHEEIKEDLEKMLLNMDVSFDEQVKEILSAYEFGFSVSEKVFQNSDDGKISLKSIKTRNPVTWLLHQDEFGEVINYEQRGITSSFNVPKEGLIHYVNERKFSNPYGTSDLRAAHTAWFIKKNITRFLAIFLEKAASPIPVAKYDSGVTNQTVTDIFNVIKKFQTKTALVIPKEFEMDFLEAKGNGEAYHKAINLMNMFIARSLFMPDLMGLGGSETSGGSFSLGEHQINLFFNHINQRKKLIERMINKHIITPLIRVNYGDLDNPPEFRLLSVDDRESVSLAQAWADAVGKGFFRPTDDEINHFRNSLKFPESDESSVVETPKEQLNEDKEEDKPRQREIPQGKEEFKLDNKVANRRVNVNLIKSQLDTAEMSVIDETKPLFESIIEDYISKIKSKKIIENEDLEGLNKIKVKKSNKLKQIFTRTMRELFKNGARIARTEVRSDFGVTDFDNDFLKFVDVENLNYLADWEYQFSKDVRLSVVKAIKEGLPISSAIRGINKEARKFTDESIHRYSRTKFTEIMNKGRHSVFEKSNVVSGFQFSAIIDGRTTRICSGLHNKVFKKGTEPIPSLHFGCRSLLIPTLVSDNIEPDTKVGGTKIEKFIDDNIGKGFSKR